MKFKMKARLSVDFLMSVLMLLLTTYQLLEHEIHEWLGAGMLFLFIIHTLLNIRWYGNLFLGKYNALRIFQTVLNFAVLASIVCLGYSGIIMSRHVFAFLPIESGMALARAMHLSASYWGFVLMSMHLGMHWGMIMAMMKKAAMKKAMMKKETGSGAGAKLHNESGLILRILLRVLAAAISAYGLYAFISNRLISYMLLLTQFAFFDYEAPAWRIVLEYFSVAALFTALGYYTARLIRKIGAKGKGAEV